MIVNIYIDTDSVFPRSSEKHYGYVLECIIRETPYTREGFGSMTGTYNEVTLTAAKEALNRINTRCEVHLFTRNIYVLDMIDRNLDKWVENDFTGANGQKIKNAELWREVYEASKECNLVPEPGEHSYSRWIKEEIEKQKRGKTA